MWELSAFAVATGWQPMLFTAAASGMAGALIALFGICYLPSWLRLIFIVPASFFAGQMIAMVFLP